MWYRVFGGRDVEVPPAELLAELRRLGVTAPVRFHGDDQGWFRAVVLSPADKPLVEVNRYLASEEGIRAELNTWASWLETAAPERADLLEQVVLAPQLFTVQLLEEGEEDHVWEGVCRFLAARTDGCYQIDSRGFFDPRGMLLIAEGEGSGP